jgi:tetratricopeptide (TPR) repeat protein
MTTEATVRDSTEARSTIERAFVLHKEGRVTEPAALYRSILAREPDNRRALLLLAMLLSDGPEAFEAEALLRRRLNVPPAAPILPEHLAPSLHEIERDPEGSPEPRIELAMVCFELGKLRQIAGDDREAILLFETASTLKPDYALAFNNLALSLHRIAQRDLALAMVDRALAIDPDFVIALRNRGHILLEARRPEEACVAFEARLAREPDSIDALIDLGIAALAVPDAPRAEAIFRRALALDPSHVQAHVQLANTLDHEHRAAEALVHRRLAARHHGIVHQPSSDIEPQARVLVVGGAGMCNLSLQFLLERKRFHATVAYLQAEGEDDPVADAPLDQFGPTDIVINAVADADNGADFLAKAQRFCDRFAAPVINPPDQRVARTTRDGVASLLEGVPGLTVPAMRRIGRGALAEFARAGGSFARPLLVRPIGAHGGDDLDRIDDTAALTAYLERIPCDEFYLSEFHDYRSDDGHWRKYRLIFIDREVYPYHLTIGRDWKLHYYRVDMGEQPWMKVEEEAFLADWRSVFTAARGDAIREVGRRLDLDFAGIDCAISRDGNVLMFEANPSMLVHLTDSRVTFPYKHRYVPRIFDAFGRMLIRRIVSGAGKSNACAA